MKTLLSLKPEITQNDCFTHLIFPFVVNEDYARLSISYSYFPKEYEGDDAVEKAFEAFKEAYGDATITMEDVRGELPLKNHVTLSLSKEGKLIGTAHRHANEMVVEVGEKLATVGFNKTPIAKGNYAILLSVHALLSDKVTANLEVVAYE